MGLGKTLSLLALICWSLESLANNVIASDEKESRVTLVIAPKSSISTHNLKRVRELRLFSNIWLERADQEV